MSVTWNSPERIGAASGVGDGIRGIMSLIRMLAGRVRGAYQARPRLRDIDHLNSHLLRDIGARDLRRDAADLRDVADRLMLMSDRPRHI